MNDDKPIHPLQQCLRDNGEQIAAAVTEAQFREVLKVNEKLKQDCMTYLHEVEQLKAELTELKGALDDANTNCQKWYLEAVKRGQELAALKGQAKVVGWHQPDDPFHITANPQICANWHREGLKVAAVYAAPVAKQEVISRDEYRRIAFEVTGMNEDHCFVDDELDRFVTRLNGGKPDE